MKSVARRNLWMLASGAIAFFLFISTERAGLVVVTAVSIGSYLAAIAIQWMKERSKQ